MDSQLKGKNTCRVVQDETIRYIKDGLISGYLMTNDACHLTELIEAPWIFS